MCVLFVHLFKNETHKEICKYLERDKNDSSCFNFICFLQLGRLFFFICELCMFNEIAFSSLTHD